MKEYWIIFDLKRGRSVKQKETGILHFEYYSQAQNYIQRQLKDVHYKRYIIMRKKNEI